MNDNIVTGGGHLVAVPIPGTDRTYTLRAPTFGEVGAMAARQAGTPVPSDAIFVDALRQAIRDTVTDPDAQKAHLAAIDAAEDAGDELNSLYAVHGTDRTGWDADARAAIAAADRAASAAQRGRARAEWAVRDAAPLADLRRHQMQAGRREQTDLLILCLTGDDAPQDAAAVDAMPAGDVLVLYERAMKLLRPDAATEKN